MYKTLVAVLAAATIGGAAFAQTSTSPGSSSGATSGSGSTSQMSEERCNAMTGAEKTQCLSDARSSGSQNAPGASGSGSMGSGSGTGGSGSLGSGSGSMGSGSSTGSSGAGGGTSR
jgi:hypothetical protein